MEKKSRLWLFLLTMFLGLYGCQTITQNLPTILTAPFMPGYYQTEEVLDPAAFSFTEDFFLTADYLPEQWPRRIPPEDLVPAMLAQLNKEQDEGVRNAFALVRNRQVNHYLARYQGEARGHLKTSLEKGAAYLPYITAVFKQENIPAELAYLALLESNFNVNAYSQKHAAGMWQFMRGTAQRCGLRVDRWVDERLDFEKSTRAAAFYLKQLHAAFGSWHLAVAAYNAGELPIRNAICRNKSTAFWDITKRSSLKCETINFVPQLIAVAIIAENPAAYGFTDLRYQQPVRYDTVIIAEATDLKRASRLRKVAYTREETDQRYTLYRVKSGDTLWSIARSYHIKPAQIKLWNKLNGTVLHPGTELRLILPLEKMI